MTATAGRARSARPVLHPRICAAVTAASCLAHLWFAVSGQHGAWLSVLMVALTGVCLPCVLHIWRRGHVGSLHKVIACALAMVAVHAVLLLGAGSAGHSHTPSSTSAVSAAAASTAAAADPSGAAGLLGVIALEITTAMLAATLVSRLRRLSAARVRSL